MTRPSAVVIGSGFGGLSTAIRLQSSGWQVTLLEQREKVGGRAYQFKEAGYTFDMGPSLVTAPDLIQDVFACASRSMEDYLDLVPLDPFYRIYFHDGTFLDYSSEADDMKRQMRAFNPKDADNYDAFMEAIRPIYEAVIEQGLGRRPFNTFKQLFEFAPLAVKLGAHRRVSSFASKYFDDFRHHFLFSFHPLFIGGNPFRVPSVYIMIPYLEKKDGVWFTKGGMYSIVESFASLFQDIGGRILTSTQAERIEVADGTAVGVHAGGEFFKADAVVSNADTVFTYNRLLEGVPKRRWTERRISGLNQSMSCFLLYIGARRQYEQLKHHTLILSQRYEQLIRDIFDRKILADDFSMYLHAPTRTDSGMAPPGCESLYVLVPVPNLGAGIDWTEMEPVMTERVLDFLEDWGLTDLRENTEVLRTFTPVDFQRELGAWQGSAFGIEPRLTQTAIFRPHNRSEDVRNLYFAGAGTHPGAGVPGVLLSAEATAFAIEQDFGLPKQSEGSPAPTAV
jgi:phytoene desaturase